MYEFLYNSFVIACVLGVLVFIHEFGHYAAAKLFGVRVETFSIGFGKRLFGFRRGETDYRVSVLPLGGYVKMAGENPFEASTGDPGEFMAHPRWQRFVIAIAGPAMNVAFSFWLVTFIFMNHFEHPYYKDHPATMGWVLPGSPADKAHLQAGDRIIKVDGIENPTWEVVEQKEVLNPNQKLDLQIQREAQVFGVSVTPVPVGPEQYGQAGWEPSEPNTIVALFEGMPAEKAGLREGDEILALDSVVLHSASAVLSHLQSTKGQPVRVTFKRGGAESAVMVTPILKDLNGKQTYLMGVEFGATHVDKLPFGQAMFRSYEMNRTYSTLIFQMVGKLITKQVSIKQMSSVIGMAKQSGDEARKKGWVPILFTTAIISLNLGIFNLMPIPILDGGLILMLCIEGLLRRDIKREIKEFAYQAAFLLLVVFAVVVMFNDFAKTSVGDFILHHWL